jgi:hypothetical protein
MHQVISHKLQRNPNNQCPATLAGLHPDCETVCEPMAWPGGINLGFADNYVELVRLENLWQPTWHKTWKVPAKRPGR